MAHFTRLDKGYATRVCTWPLLNFGFIAFQTYATNCSAKQTFQKSVAASPPPMGPPSCSAVIGDPSQRSISKSRNGIVSVSLCHHVSAHDIDMLCTYCCRSLSNHQPTRNPLLLPIHSHIRIHRCRCQAARQPFCLANFANSSAKNLIVIVNRKMMSHYEEAEYLCDCRDFDCNFLSRFLYRCNFGRN